MDFIAQPRSKANKMEFVSPEGLRLDGRRPRELRRLNCEIDVLGSADGSAIFEMGNTKVETYTFYVLSESICDAWVAT